MTRTRRIYVKRYTDSQRCTAARAHHAWLADLRSGVRLPALRSYSREQLVFEHLGHDHPGPQHLDLLADALGRLHAAAHTRWLRKAPIDQPVRCGELVIVDFITPRRSILQTINLPVHGRPAAVYKDANIRNFLLAEDGPALVDFDDLTLAPFGYDLAKLIVTVAMTYGPLSHSVLESALHSYNRRTAQLGPGTACHYDQLHDYADVHHQLTARYLHQHGYRYAWPDVQPKSRPRGRRAAGC